jgi:hypothetical protein
MKNGWVAWGRAARGSVGSIGARWLGQGMRIWSGQSGSRGVGSHGSVDSFVGWVMNTTYIYGSAIHHLGWWSPTQEWLTKISAILDQNIYWYSGMADQNQDHHVIHHPSPRPSRHQGTEPGTPACMPAPALVAVTESRPAGLLFYQNWPIIGA